MAFRDSAWGMLASAPTLRIYSYDAKNGDDVTETGYFDSKRDEVRLNDLIYAETASAVTAYRISAITLTGITIAAV